jgi:hypothetical protein
MAILAMMSTASENAISESTHSQSLTRPKMAAPPCVAETAE